MIQGRLLWCDAEANCHRMADDAGVRDIVTKAKKANIDTLIVDIKPLGGEVLYNSRLAPRLGEVDGKEYPKDFDLLSSMIKHGHAEGLKIHAAINVFSEGHREWGRGPGYERPEWQCVMHEATWNFDFSNGVHFNAEYLNPWNPVEQPIIYSRKSGNVHICGESRVCYSIENDTVTAISQSGDHIQISEKGCILSLPESQSVDINEGDKVSISAKPVLRKAAESRMPSWGIFVNPIGPARDYELNIVEELASNYNIDALVFDRMRYPNLHADFSETSRKAFCDWLGIDSISWLHDVFAINDKPWEDPIHGKYYKQWLEWRAWQIRDFADEAIKRARKTKPDLTMGVYVGSWYDSYFDVGVNWGNANFHAGYSWMTPDYNQTGYAELFDYICTGCYYPTLTREEAKETGRPEGATVEASCDLSMKAIADACPVYGSLYLKDYTDNGQKFLKAMEIAVNRTKGVMLFDLIYLEEYGWWPIVQNMFKEKAISPHDL